MCGINGAFAWSAGAPPPCLDELERTRDWMVARGPDGKGAWISEDRRCLLGHRRLSIIDLSDRALQPMTSVDGRLTIVFNGEIYNFPELRAEAEATGARFRTTSDTEILLHLHATRGSKMVEALRGMFAFAIWDGVERSLFLARDPFGIKPLYYSTGGGTFRFASQVKALRTGGGISSKPDPAGVVGFVLMGSVPEPFTWYRDIVALPAGHHLTVRSNGVGEARGYVKPATILAEAARHTIARYATLGAGRAAVRDSISAHLLADVPIGVFLSAGIDSAAILGIAREASSGPLHAVTLGFKEFAGTEQDEVPLATRIAKYYGAEHHVRYIGRDEFLADLPNLLDAMDQPSIDGVNTWFVAKATREAGLKVALSGVGGDEMLGGYPSFHDVPKWHSSFGRLARLPGLGGVASGILRLIAPGFVARNPKAAGLLRYTGTLGGSYMVRRSLRLPDDIIGMLDPDVIEEGLARLDIIERMNAAIDPMPGSPQAAVSLLELGFYMRNQLLRDADWAGMRHSVEIRTPFVDIALFRRLAPLIPQLAPGEGKQLLAQSPTKPLPNWHRYRPKTGFSVPYAHWLAEDSCLSVPGAAPQRKNGLVSRDWSAYVLDRYQKAA